MFHLHGTHRCVGGDDRGAVHVLPFRNRGSDVEQAPALLARQRPADRPLTLWQVLDVISERSPSAAELQHPRQNADIHVDRTIRDACIVTSTAIVLAVIAESGTSPKCFLTMLSRSCSSS